jgi:apolipoprotein N-acyltransferase
LSNTAADSSPQLIVWPETATPCNLRYEPQYLHRVKAQIDSLNIPLLTGTPDYSYLDGEFKSYNSAFLIQPHDAHISSYAKMQLVPFGERAPYQDNFPFKYIKKLLDQLELGHGDWSRGGEVVVFALPQEANKDSLRFSVPICYESVFPDLVRKFVRRGAEFLVVITNDAWFGRASWPNVFSGGLYQHAQIATFRAIENRIAIARCANTGISLFIDKYGRVRQATKIFEEDVIIDTLGLRSQTTFYTQYGNIFSYVMSAVTLFALMGAVYSKYSSK